MSDNQSHAVQVFCEYANRYLNVQAYELRGLKAMLEEPNNQSLAEDFQVGLSDTLAGDGIDLKKWEELTEAEYEDGDMWLDYLQAIYDFLYEDGPYVFDE